VAENEASESSSGEETSEESATDSSEDDEEPDDDGRKNPAPLVNSKVTTTEFVTSKVKESPYSITERRVA